MDVVSFAWSLAVSRVPFPNRRSGVIGLAIAGDPKMTGTCHPGKRRSGMRPSRTHKNGCANEATTGLTFGLFVMLFQDVVFGPLCNHACGWCGAKTGRAVKAERTAGSRPHLLEGCHSGFGQFAPMPVLPSALIHGYRSLKVPG
jgi:hypothetical protein